MTNRRFAGLLGGVYLFIGLLGALIYLFPVGALHQMLHLTVGIWGLTAASSVRASVSFARKTALVFAVVAIVELTPSLRGSFALLLLTGSGFPILHILSAMAAAYYGFYWTDAVLEAQRHADATTETRKAA